MLHNCQSTSEKIKKSRKSTATHRWEKRKTRSNKRKRRWRSKKIMPEKMKIEGRTWKRMSRPRSGEIRASLVRCGRIGWYLVWIGKYRFGNLNICSKTAEPKWNGHVFKLWPLPPSSSCQYHCCNRQSHIILISIIHGMCRWENYLLHAKIRCSGVGRTYFNGIFCNYAKNYTSG